NRDVHEMPKKIIELYAFIATDNNGDEGITAMLVGNKWLPMVGADMDRIESLRPVAEKIAGIHGQKIIIAKFTNRVHIEDIVPQDMPIKDKWK
ncbi:hypothetical protein LCGC14_2534710, partial [marine sediment metagenome]